MSIENLQPMYNVLSFLMFFFLAVVWQKGDAINVIVKLLLWGLTLAALTLNVLPFLN